MGRKLTAVRFDRKSEPKGTHKKALVVGSRRHVSRAFRVKHSKSAEESSGIHQIFPLRGRNIICCPSESIKNTQGSQRVISSGRKVYLREGK